MEIRAKLIIKNYELEKRRIALKYTQADFAEIVGMSINKYQGIENLKLKPNEEEARNIALELDCPIKTLFPQGYEKIVTMFATSNRELITDYTAPLLESGEEIKQLSSHLDAKQFVAKALDKMTPRERKIIEMRFGLKDGDTHNLDEVGAEFDVTRERIRQVEAKALERVRDALHYKEIKL